MHEPVRTAVTVCARSPEKSRRFQDKLFREIILRTKSSCPIFSFAKGMIISGFSRLLSERSQPALARFSVTVCAREPEKSRKFQDKLFKEIILRKESSCPIFLFDLNRSLSNDLRVFSRHSSPQNCINSPKRTASKPRASYFSKRLFFRNPNTSDCSKGHTGPFWVAWKHFWWCWSILVFLSGKKT